MIKNLSLNINGLGKDVKKEWVKEIIKNQRINTLCIQETKRERTNEASIRSLWGNKPFMWVEEGSIGNSGGILTI